VALYAPLVYGWCQGSRLQTADTADVLQEVFLAVARNIVKFRHGGLGQTFRGWLRTITRNKINDLYRRRGIEPDGEGGTEAGRRLAQWPEVLSASSADDAEPGEDAEEPALFQAALARIRGEFASRTWQAFWRTAVDGRTAAEAAGELGMTAGAVRVAKSRVLQRLREELGDFDRL